MNSVFKNSFSWSLSRYNLFNFCERAYYLHYYEAWNGWDIYAAKQAFRLKHLKSKELWLNIILKKSLLNAINNKPLSNNTLAVELKYQSRKILSSNISSVHSEEWRNDPKKICIDELYYKENSIDQVIDWVKDKANYKIAILQESKLLHKLSNLPYTAFFKTDGPLSFIMNGVQIWCSPDLIWSYHGKINILNLNNSSGWPFLAGLNTLYAEQNLNYALNDIVCHTVVFNENSYFSVYGIRSPKEITCIVTDSSKEMQSRLTYNQKAYVENFSKTAKQNKCQTCRFKAIC